MKLRSSTSKDTSRIIEIINDAKKYISYEKDLSLMGNAKSAVIVISGVNGVGKTTSIGKLGKYFKDNCLFESSDIEFVIIVGLYLTPPKRSAFFC